MINTQVKKPLIPAQWYEILKFKKVEVIAQLTARSISHNITTHIMTLKSKLYKAIKQGVKSLTSQFNALIGDDWTEALQESGKTLKQFKKDLLRKFHPDLHGGSNEATTICQTINEWEEPSRYDHLDGRDIWSHKSRDYWRATLSKEEFLRAHKLFVKNAHTQTVCNPHYDFYDAYIVSWHSVYFGDFDSESYQGQDFAYKAPYEEEHADGTIQEPMTTEELMKKFWKAWEHYSHPDTQWEIHKKYGWTDRAEFDVFQQKSHQAMVDAGWC